MKASIIAIGSELLGPERLDTNSLRLTRVLERYGVTLLRKSVVGDDEALVARELERRASESDLVLVTGGLGPTADDLTRPAAARAFGRVLSIDEDLVESLRQLFAAYGRPMTEVNRRQAEVIGGARLLKNPVGTAPGWHLESESGATVYLFPGVPRELEAMIASELEPWLEQTLGQATAGLERRTFKVASRPESEVEQRLQPFYQRFSREALGVLASPGEVRLVFSAMGQEEQRHAELETMAACLRELLGSWIYTEQDEDLAQTVGRHLVAGGRTVATAESCTGGLIAERLTRAAGSSQYFLGALVTYCNELKQSLLGVGVELLREHGAVSEEVARAMALGARERSGADYTLAVTGIAGPGGATEGKPVGTVHLALAGPSQESGTPEPQLVHRRVRLPGDRERVRQQTAQLALEMLRLELIRAAPNGD